VSTQPNGSTTLPAHGCSIDIVGRLLRDPLADPATLSQDLFTLVQTLKRHGYLGAIVGSLAALTYLQGRGPRDIDIIAPESALEHLPGIIIEKRSDRILTCRYRSLRVDLWLASDPLYQLVAQRFTTPLCFNEIEIPRATVEGLILIKLYAMPTLTRLNDHAQVAQYKDDIRNLHPQSKFTLSEIAAILQPYLPTSDWDDVRRHATALESHDRTTRP